MVYILTCTDSIEDINCVRTKMRNNSLTDHVLTYAMCICLWDSGARKLVEVCQNDWLSATGTFNKCDLPTKNADATLMDAYCSLLSKATSKAVIASIYFFIIIMNVYQPRPQQQSLPTTLLSASSLPQGLRYIPVWCLQSSCQYKYDNVFLFLHHHEVGKWVPQD